LPLVIIRQVRNNTLGPTMAMIDPHAHADSLGLVESLPSLDSALQTYGAVTLYVTAAPTPRFVRVGRLNHYGLAE
jgi:hypothetical protein